MSDADADAERKAKAERAKKLLAQRQKAKKKAQSAAAASDSPSIAPSSPASTLADTTTVPSARTSLSLDDSVRAELQTDERAASEPTETPSADVENKADAGPNAGKVTDGDKEPIAVAEQKDAKFGTSASTEVTNSATTESQLSPTRRPTMVGPPSAESNATLQETVSLLIAERSDLQTQLADVKAQLATAKGDSQLLAEGRILIAQLEEDKKSLEARSVKAEEEAAKVTEMEGEASKISEELQDLRKERDELRFEKEKLGDQVRAAIESEKEKIEELETALERSRGREGGLEAEVGRLRQNNTELSSNLDKVTVDLESLKASSSLVTSTLTDLQTAHEALQKSHEILTSEHSTLQSSHSELTSTHSALRSTHDKSSSELKSIETTLASTKAELESVKSKLGSVTKRAETAEKRKTALQSENDELIKQLEEVRGKVVEAMEEKVQLAQEVESWEVKAKGWENQRSELEAQAAEASSLHEQISAMAEENRAKASRLDELEVVESQLPEVRKRLSDAQSTIEKDVTVIAALQNRLEDSQVTATDNQNLIASLRTELQEARSAKSASDKSATAEADGVAPPNSQSVPEAESAHALAISDLNAQIRNLESSLHSSTSRFHTLSKQLTDLQIAYALTQKERDEALAALGGFSPSASGSATRGSGGAKGFFLSPADEYPSPSASASTSAPFPPLSIPNKPRLAANAAVDAILPPSVRHKRQVSLNALKARMEPRTIVKMDTLGEEDGQSNGGLSTGDMERTGSAASTPGLGGKSKSHSIGGTGTGMRGPTTTTKQFGDEIMFCCPACQGDLITL
ncbi:hypothetical protein IAR55_007151 [Kwoniella newhampshirensis]|uniref:Uncharacterized protein n=1 Tax=Kwoniella newhampshirensis TaxID=1651941 RepID=A0AAW0YG72_9TREE